MKKLITFLFSFLLGIVFFLGLFKYIISWRDLVVGFSRFSFWEGVFVLLLSFLFTAIAIIRWREILKSKDHYYSVPELVGPYLASFAITYLIPVGIFWADFLRCRMIGEKDFQSPEKKIASVFIDRILNTFSNLLIIFPGSFVFLIKIGCFPQELSKVYLGVLLFLGFILIFIFIFLFYSNVLDKAGILDFILNSFSGQKHLGKQIKKEILGFFSLRNPGLKTSFLLSILGSFIAFIQCWAMIFFLGGNLSFLSALAVFGVSFAALETPISADLGSHDLTTALVFDKMGMDRSAGVAHALIFRGANLVLTGFGIFFLLKFGFQGFKQSLLIKIEKLISLKDNHGKP